MNNFYLKILNQRGVGLIDVMIAMGISAVVSFALLSAVQQGGKLSQKGSLRASHMIARQNIQKILYRYDSVQATVNSNPTSFNCVFDGSCGVQPAEGVPFDLYTRNEDGDSVPVYTPAALPQIGLWPDGSFTRDGVYCTPAPSTKCPVRVDLTWRAECMPPNPACSPPYPVLITIYAKFKLHNPLEPGVVSATSTSTTGTDYNITLKTSIFSDCTLPWDGETTIPHGDDVEAFRHPHSDDCSDKITRVCNRGVLSGDSAYAYGRCGCLSPWGTVLDPGESITAYAAAMPTTIGDLCSDIDSTRTCQELTGLLDGNASHTSEFCTEKECTGADNAMPWLITPIPHGGSVYAYSDTSHGTDCALVRDSRLCTAGDLDKDTFVHQTCIVAGNCTLPWGGQIPIGASVTAYQLGPRQSPTCISETRNCVAGPNLTGTFQYQTCTSCAGYADNTGAGSCWYLGIAGKNCNTTCATHGGVTSNYISDTGSSGTTTKCLSILSSLGYGGATNGDETCGVGLGCMFKLGNILPGGSSNPRRRCRTPTTTPTAADWGGTGVRRVCSCAL